MADKPHASAPLALLISVFIFAVVVSGCAEPAAAVGTPEPQIGGQVARLEGRVYGEHGQNLAQARVRLETTEGDLVVESAVGEQGRYSFGGVTRGVYHLSATVEGYENFRTTVDLTRSPFRTIVDIAMTPLTRGKSSGEPPALTDASAPKKARREYEKGMKALAANRVSEAKAHFSKAVENYPCYARAQTAVALGFISDRDLAGAEAALKKAIACDPGYSSGYLKLGELYNIESRYRESEPMLQEGLRRDPALWKFHFQLGVAYFGLGLYDKAQQQYQLSESLTPPAPPEVHVKLADVYFKQRLFRKAYVEMKSYLGADPNGRFATKVRDLIQQMDAYRDSRTGTPGSPAARSDQP